MSSNKKTLIDGDFQVGSNHFKVDTENNYVGFNNATPQNKIDVQIGTRTGTHSTDKPLYVTGVTSTSGAEFVSDDGTAGIGIGSSNIFTTETNQNITIAPDGTGAVGIKTSTPNPSGETFDLWVQGDTKITGNVTAGQLFGDGSGLFNVPGTQWVSSSEDIYFLNNTGSGEGRVSIGTSTPVSLLTLEGTSRGNPPITGTEGTSNAIVRIRDDNNVTLDIGTTGASPWTTWIQSSDATSMGTNYPISLNPNGGNVGVGTSSPGAPLEVSKSAGGEMLRLTNGTGTLYAGVDANPPWFGTSSDDHLRLVTNGTEKVRIESGGKVGIGTDTPSYKLDVDGDIKLRGQGFIYTANETSDSAADRYFMRLIKTLDASYPMLCNRTPNGDVVIATGTSSGGNDVERMRFNGGDGTRDIEVTNANFIVSGNLTAGTIDASKISNATVGDSTGGVKAVYFENTEMSITHYTDKQGILAFDENFHPDTTYGTGTYDPSSTFVGGDGGGLLIKNEDGWGAIFTSQNTRWAKGYWNSLDVSGTVTATSFSGALSGNASTATSLETARTIGGVSFDGSANITPTTFEGATFSGDVAFDTDTLFVDVSANRVGIGTTDPSAPLHIYKRDDTFGSLVELLRLERYTNDFDDRIDAAGGYIGFHANDGNSGLGEVARISFRQKGESSTANAENDGGMGFWTKLNDSLAQRVTIAPNGRVGIGTTAPSNPLHVSASTTSTHTMRITHSDTNATSGTHALLIDANYSGSDTFTGDKTNAGIYIDLDSSATGGDTSHEHRIYGVYSDVRHSGDSDICYSGYFHARSDHTSGQCSALRGVYGVSVDSANGTNSNNTAGEFKALKDAGSTNTTTTMMGVRAEVEIDAGTVTNAYAVHGHIDRDGGTITNGFLFHGSYAGDDTGAKWGLYLTGDENNHVDGSFGIGVTPSEKLEVSGNIKLNGSGHQIYFDTGGAGLYWGDGYSRIVDNNDLRICTDDNLHFNTGCSSSSLGTERMVIKSDGDVGIGTADPLGRLHVSGGNGDCVVVIQADENNSGESDNPTLLFIQDGTFRTSEIGNDTNNGMVYRSYGDQIWYSSSVHSNTSNTALKDNQTERMRLTNGGNFGINTTAPEKKLHVNGTSRFDGEMQWGLGHTSHAGYSTNKDWYIRSGSSSGKVIIQDTGGNTGIGTSSPSQKLHVDGNIKLSGSGRQIYLDTGGAGLYWGAGYTRIVDDGNLRVCTDDIMHFNTGSNSGSLGTERMRIEASGLAYFNNALRVYGIEATINYTSSNYAYKATGLVPDPGAYSFGLYVDRNVRSQGYVAFSDRRIKSNVVDINDTTALDQLRQLQPKYYEYVDKVARGSSTVIGFIAQEVKEVVPQAVSVADGLIPNIYQTANVSANTITFTNFDTSDLDATSNTLAVFEGGETRKDLTIVEVVDEHTIRVDKDIAGEDVFVYGQVVQDFHHINKDYLWTIGTAALQEVDRQLQAEKVKTKNLEALVLSLITRVQKLEAR